MYFGYWNRLSPYIVPDSDASCMWVVFYVGWPVRTCVDSTNIRPLLLFIHQSCRHRSKERKKKKDLFRKMMACSFFYIESISQRKYSKTEQLLINILSRRYIILSSRLYLGIDNRSDPQCICAVRMPINPPFLLDWWKSVGLSEKASGITVYVDRYLYLSNTTYETRSKLYKRTKNEL